MVSLTWKKTVTEFKKELIHAVCTCTCHYFLISDFLCIIELNMIQFSISYQSLII